MELSAVVKELLENAIDGGQKRGAARPRLTCLSAGADNVVIQISEDLADITVKDNGCGVPVDGRQHLGGAHCTSKIVEFEDLYSCATLGFRGEAGARTSGPTLRTRRCW